MSELNKQTTKILLDKVEYDYLREASCQLMFIRTAMVQYMAAYRSTKRVYLENEFLTILKILFPRDYGMRECELLEEQELLQEEGDNE